MTTDYLPVRYVLYSHYPEGKDFENHQKGTELQNLQGLQDLTGHLKGLRGLLTWPGYEGLLVLFYAPGLAKWLEGIANGVSEKDLLHTCEQLKFARVVDSYLEELVKTEYEELVPRLRFVTALDLHKIFGLMRNPDIVDSLKSWIVGDIGDSDGIRYDSPKIVEAIVRLRLLGTGVPVFRVDHDVLFRRGENWEKKNLEFSSTIGSCLTAYQLKRDSPNLSSFILSGSYDHQALHNPDEAKKFDTWNRAFGTRVYPALLVKQDLMTETVAAIEIKGKSQGDAWDRYATKSFSESLARKFLGFETEGLKTARVGGIGEIGAHPLASVISGAMLYLSDGAILDLPPFSNFRLNVSWIDDHLKYSLHRELRHLSPVRLRTLARDIRANRLMAYSKLDDVIVQKAGRTIDKDLRNYIFDDYLPTLLRGSIMDAWITHNPVLKYRPEALKDRDEWDRIPRETQSFAVLPCALQKAIGKGSFKRGRYELEKDLFDVALNRINQVRRQWIQLTEAGQDTFASVWAKGEAKLRFPDLELKYSGIADAGHVSPGKDIPKKSDLDGDLLVDLINLVADAQIYIEWTLAWPKIVQVVRSVEQGTLRTDLNFDPEREDRIGG